MLRIARRGLLALPALMIPGLARADAWPGRTRLVVGFAPGGANDIMARLLVAEYNALIPGGSFVVENRPGAGTLLAAQNILGAPPDGNHLLYASTSTSRYAFRSCCIVSCASGTEHAQKRFLYRIRM